MEYYIYIYIYKFKFCAIIYIYILYIYIIAQILNFYFMFYSNILKKISQDSVIFLQDILHRILYRFNCAFHPCSFFQHVAFKASENGGISIGRPLLKKCRTLIDLLFLAIQKRPFTPLSSALVTVH